MVGVEKYKISPTLLSLNDLAGKQDLALTSWDLKFVLENENVYNIYTKTSDDDASSSD